MPWPRDGIALIDGEMHTVCNVPPTGYRTIPLSELTPQQISPAAPANGVLENQFFRVVYDGKKGQVTSWFDKRAARELIRPNSKGLGCFLYERFSADQCDAFMHDYCPIFPEWVTTQFTKPKLPRDVPYRAISPKAASTVSTMEGDGYRGFLLTFQHSPDLPCDKLELEVRLFDALPIVDVSISIHGKHPDTWPEAGWLAFPWNIKAPNFRLSRLGGIVDPEKDIIPGSNRHLLWLHHGMAVYGSDGFGVGICPLDSPLVSLGEPGCWKFSKDFVPKTPDVFVNLFNNQWNTNFRLWNEGSWRQTVRLWTFDSYDAESALIRPALEARFPIAGSACANNGSPRNLPAAAAGLQLSRPSVLVTSFGVDSATDRLMLRLWEQAARTVRAKSDSPQD